MTDSNSGPASENRPYLGDPQTISKLLQNIARETIQCRIAAGQKILSPEDANLIEEKEATGAARALLGRDQKYAVDPNWNVPGVIDGFLKNELALQEKGAEPILVQGLLKFVREIHERLDLLENPKQDSSSESRIQDILEKYRNLLLGLSAAPAVEAAAPIAAPVTAPIAPPTPAQATVAPAPQIVTPAPVPAPAPVQIPAPTKVEPLAPAAAALPKQAPKAVAPAATPIVTAAPEPRKATEPARGGGLKWAALIILLLVIGGGTFFFLKKPAPAPVVEAPVEKPAAPKSVASAPVLNSSGTIDLIEQSGKTVKTISLQSGQKIGHLYDFLRVSSKTSFLIGTESTEETLDLWLIDESGAGRQVNPSVIDAKFSPDGSKIAYTTAEHILTVEELDGTSLASTASAFDFTWSPDNNSVVFIQVREGFATTHPEALNLSKLVLASKDVEILLSGLYDNAMPIVQPAGKYIFMVAGKATGLPAFWKIATSGGETVQVTNIRLDETGDIWVPTPFSTAQWSADGKWLLYDFKDGAIEQIWGLEFDDAGNLKRSARITDGLLPRWIENGKFVCLKAVNGIFEASVQSVP